MQEIGITKSPRPFRRIAVVALGWVLIVLGIAGLVLPVMPGAVLIVVGALMVDPQGAWPRRMLDKCRVRFPVLAPVLRRLSTWSESREILLKKNPADSGARFEV
jgi:uncharacterized membrane protein YbaN (DUF454 family)